MLKFTSFKRQYINLVFKMKVFVVSKIWYFNKSIYFYFPKIWVVTGRPRGSKNKATATAAVASSSVPVKRCLSRPAGSKNKLKVPSTAPGPSAPSANASPPPPRIYSFFCITGAQCLEIQLYR
jgi:hypothetical protein